VNLLVLILIIILLCGGVGTFPAWQHSQGYGYWPSGSMGLLLIILLVLALTGRI
jgi:Protein of unknown function (DUF3309)